MAKKLLNSDPIKLNNVRLSFPTLKEPSRFDPDNERENPKYRASFLLDPKEHADVIKALKIEAKRLVDEMWGGKPNGFKDIECFGDGNTKTKDDGTVYDGYTGMFYVSANNIKRPMLLNRDKTQVDKDEIDDVFYGGCYVNASVGLWTQDNKFGKAIRCTLRGIQFRKDGEAFGAGSVDIDNEFDDIEFGDEQDDFDL